MDQNNQMKVKQLNKELSDLQLAKKRLVKEGAKTDGIDARIELLKTRQENIIRLSST